MTAVHRTRSHHTTHRSVARRPPATPRTARRLLAVGTFAVIGLGVHGVLSGPGDVPASAAGAGPTPVVRTVKVQAGDTLWSIAQLHHGSVPIQRYVDELVERNGGTTQIDVGQLVHLP